MGRRFVGEFTRWVIPFLALGSSCTGAIDDAERLGPSRRPSQRPSLLHSAVGSAAEAEVEDSLIAVEEAIAWESTIDRDRLPDADEDPPIDGQVPEQAAEPAEIRMRTRSARVNWALGTRRALTGRIVPGRFVEGALKWGDSKTTGYIALTPSGWLRRLHAGNLKIRMGERLILGRGFGAYAASSAPPAAGFAFAPSLSRWSSRLGIGAGLELGKWRGDLVLTKPPPRGPPGVPGAIWVSVLRHSNRRRIGFAFGAPLFGTGREAAVESPSAWTGVAAAHAAWAGDAFETSLETDVVTGGVAYAAVGIRGRSAHRWSLRFFRAPHFEAFSGPEAAFRPADVFVQGATASWNPRLRAARLRLFGGSGRLASSSGPRSFQRLSASLSNDARGGIAWEVAGRWYREARFSYSADELIVEDTRRLRNTGRLRAAVMLGDDTSVTHRLTVDYFVGERARGAGILLTVFSAVRIGGLFASWAVSAFALDSGHRASISRPRADSFEGFAFVTGRGSDIALRLRWRYHEALMLFGYIGLPWNGERRVYMGGSVGR